MRHAASPGRRDLMVAAAAFWAITTLAFTAGRWFMPAFAMPSLVEALSARGATADQLQAAAVFDLRSVMVAPPHPVAALDATGALEGRYTFESVDGFELTEVEPGRFDVSVRLRGSVGVLLVAGSSLPVDAVQIDGFSVTLSAPGKTFNSTTGQCSLSIGRAEPATPRIVGWVACTALVETRSGATATFVAAFDARPQF